MSVIIKAPAAQADLIEIWRFIGVNNPGSATELIRKIERKLKILAENPSIGRRREDLSPNLRSLSVGKYVIFYRPINRGIEVARILHGSRDIDNFFDRDSEEE